MAKKIAKKKAKTAARKARRSVAGAEGGPAKKVSKGGRPRRHFASICPASANPVPTGFGRAVKALEEDLRMPVWVIIQQGNLRRPFDLLDDELWDAFTRRKDDLQPGEAVGVLIHSPGGDASSAYRLADFLRQRCGGFKAIVPGMAKSAATLFALGADDIIFGEHGELGPIDAQIDDPEREHRLSVLDEAKSLERLNAFALRAVDQTMDLLLDRTRMKVSTLLPVVLEFVTNFLRPMMENIDPVKYAEMWRLLRVSEHYAKRLLREKYDPATADQIASRLAHEYPEHSFPVNAREASEAHLKVVEASPAQNDLFDRLRDYLARSTIVGRITEA